MLLVEDNGADVVLMTRAFRNQAPDIDVTAVSSVASARTALQQKKVDVLIADLMLPDGNGLELIAAANEHACPAIMLTGRGNESLAVQALRAGAVDYVVKSDGHVDEMPRVVKRALREWESRVAAERNRQLLAESEQRFRTYAELAADWFWETDPQMTLTCISEGFTRTSKLAAEDFVGSPLRKLCGDADFDWKPVQFLWDKRLEFEVEIPLSPKGYGGRTIYLRGKPFRNARHELAGYRGIGRDVTRERETLREITYLAMHDPLTDVLNRRSLEFEVRNALSNVGPGGEQHVFCFFDLDSFKHVNDDAGHLIGDQILREVVTTIAKSVRSSDKLGRMGGDEFGVLLRHCTFEHATEVTQGIVDAVANQPLVSVSPAVSLTVSAGLVELISGQDVAQVFRDADRACYEAKRAGGNTVRRA